MSETQQRSRNYGIRKICGCPRRRWPKCPHGWHLNYKPRGGQSYRLSLDIIARARGDGLPRGKTEAVKLANALRAEMDAGTFRQRADETPAADVIATPDAVTLRSFGEIYLARRGKPPGGAVSHLNRLAAFSPLGGIPLGDKALGAVTEDDVELFFDHLREQGSAASTRNKYVGFAKAMFRWGTKKGYLSRNPVADADGIKREKHAKRSRRLEPDLLDKDGNIMSEGEERRLLKAAGPHLQRLLIAALDTAMRRGELLALQWRDIDLQRRELTVRAETTKTDKTRHLPISDRLAGVLSMERTRIETFLKTTDAQHLTDQEFAALVARCYVFGDERGAKVANFKRAWETCVLKAHGHAPQWVKKTNGLRTTSRQLLDTIDLHWHDLRHEAGSRLLEGGVPLHHVQVFLGHENLSQTSTYLNATRIGLHESMRRFDDARCKPVAIGEAIEHQPLCNALAESTTQGAVN